jgi:hypothetical protein
MEPAPKDAFPTLRREALEMAQRRNREFLAKLLQDQPRRRVEPRPSGADVEFLIDRTPVLRARHQLIGRLFVVEQRWRWAWGDASVEPALAADAALVRDHGSRLGIPALTTPELPSQECEPNELTSIALFLANGEAQWLWPSSQGVFDFVVLHEVRPAAAQDERRSTPPPDERSSTTA